MILRILVMTFVLGAQQVFAQSSFNSSGRSEGFEMAIQLPYQDSLSVRGEAGTGAKVDSQFGFGIGLTWHLNSKLSVSGDMVWTSPRYQATFLVDADDDPDTPGGELVTISHRADVFTGQARATWHFLDGPITPFVEGALGFTYIDSNVASGPPTSGCWWDPWWGYICRPLWSTYDDTGFSYAAGAGVRWDVNRDYGLRASYTRRWVDIKGPSDPEFDIWEVAFLWKF